MRILCYGDSNTWGYVPNVDGYSKNAEMKRYEIQDCWWAGLMPENEVFVDGVCGRCIANESRWFKNRNASVTMDEDFEKYSDIYCVILQLGTNDCKNEYNNSAEKIAKNMQKLICKIKSKNIEKLILISPAIIKENNKITKKYYDGAEEKCKKLDVLYNKIAQIERCEFVSGKNLEVGEDGEHLTKNGHLQLRDSVVEVVNNFSNTFMSCR